MDYLCNLVNVLVLLGSLMNDFVLNLFHSGLASKMMLYLNWFHGLNFEAHFHQSLLEHFLFHRNLVFVQVSFQLLELAFDHFLICFSTVNKIFNEFWLTLSVIFIFAMCFFFSRIETYAHVWWFEWKSNTVDTVFLLLWRIYFGWAHLNFFCLFAVSL